MELVQCLDNRLLLGPCGSNYDYIGLTEGHEGSLIYWKTIGRRLKDCTADTCSNFYSKQRLGRKHEASGEATLQSHFQISQAESGTARLATKAADAI